MVGMKGSTTGADIVDCVNNVLLEYGVEMKKMVGVTTDGER